MRRLNAFAFLGLALVLLPTQAEEAFYANGGGLGLLSRNVTFSPQMAELGWKGMAKASGFETNATGEAVFDLSLPNGTGDLDGTLRAKVREDGCLAARWTMIPRKDVRVQETYIGANLRCSTYAGGHLEADGESIVLPTTLAKTAPLNRAVSTLSLFDVHGRKTFSLAFPKPRRVLVQDTRNFNCPWFGLRLEASTNLAAGQAVVIDFALSLPDGEKMTLQPCGPFVPTASEKWLPVRLTSRIVPGSAADFSSLRGSASVSAGAYGPVVVRDGHFEFERLPGVRQRFYGINLCYSACYPQDEASAERLTAFIAASGYNAIRLHLYDRDLTTDGLTPKPGWLERMDALIAAAIRHGLYVTTDLYCQRGPSIPRKSVELGETGRVGMDEVKWLVHFHEGVCSNQMEFVRMFLGHRNVKTGRRYAEEPAFALISLVNEGMLAHLKSPARGTVGYDVTNRLWREWLVRNGSRFPEVSGDLPEKTNAYGCEPVKAAMRAFYAEREGIFAGRMKHLVREELGSRALLTSLNSGTVPPEYDEFRKRCFDYTDSHFYWDHPHFLKGPWWVPTRAGHDAGNPLCTPYRGRRAGARFAGQPFTWTEFHYCVPGRFRSLSGLLTGANAAFDGWDGAWRFCWGDDRGAAAEQAMRPILSWFSVANDPMSLASERAVTALYLRGDFTKGTCPFGDGDGLDIDSAEGSIVVSTPRTCGGFRPHGTIDAGDLRVDLGRDSGAVWVSSLSDKPIAAASRLLLTHLTDGVDTGMVFADPRRGVMMSYGRHPHLLRAGRAQVSLRLQSGDWKVYALESDGTRRQSVPTVYRDGRLGFAVDVACREGDATFLYEIVR